MHIISFKKILIPTTLEVIFYSLITATIIVVSNWAVIFESFSRGIPIDNQQFGRSVSSQLAGVSASRFINIAIVVIFWGLVGLAAYTIFWLILNFFINVKNEVVIEADYVNKASFKERIRIPLMQFATAALTLVFIALSIKFLFPFWISLSRVLFDNLHTIDLQLILLLLASIIGIWITIYISWSLCKLIFVWRD